MTDTQARTSLMATALAAAGVAGMVGLVVGGPPIALAALAAAGVLGALIVACGLRAAIIGVCLFGVAPGVLGETSFVRSAVALAVVTLIVASEPGKDPVPARFGGWAAVAVGFVAFAHIGGGALVEVAFLFVISAVAVYLLARRTGLAMMVLRAVTIIVCLFAVSFIVSYITGFTGTPIATRLDARVSTIYPPFTPTTGGTLLYVGAPPRLIIGTAEPGLNVFYLMAAFSYVGTRRRSALKWGALALLLIVVVASQSSGVFIATTAGAAAAGFVWLYRRRRYVTAAAIAGAGLLAGMRLADALVASRAADNNSAVTVADRGLIGSNGTGQTSINLVVAARSAPLIAAVVAVALVVFLLIAARSLAPAPVFCVSMFAVTAVFAQPSQHQVGAWVLLAAVVMTLTPSRPLERLAPKAKRRRPVVTERQLERLMAAS